MKKIFLLKPLLTFLLISYSFLSSAQTWNLIDDTGFGYGNFQYNKMHTFKNNIYAAGGNNSPGGAYIFSSPDGAIWVEQLPFTTLIDPNTTSTTALNSTNAGGGWLFAGTRNSVEGPLVVKTTDGSSWDSLPHIPYQGMMMYYSEISSLACFNATGPDDDTVFAAVANNFDGAEIWKNYITGGPWTKVYDFPAPPLGPSRVNDMIKFNNKLYAITDDARILESADGNNWGYNVAADTGFNDVGNTEFTTMEIFQNKLYVATANNTTGPQIWNTSDGLTWTPVMANGFTNGNNMNRITDLLSANGKLWVTAYSWMSGLAFAPSTGAGRGGLQFTYIYYSSDGSTFINNNNDGFGATNRVGTLGYFNGFLYQATDNSGWAVPGAIWRLCQPPTPTISPINSSVCEYAPVYYADTLSTASSYEWYVDGVLWSTGTTFTHNPNTIGVQTIKLIERNGTCVDSITTTLTVNPNPITFNTSYPSYCYADTVHLHDTTTSGTAPFTYIWDSGGTFDTTTTADFIFPATTGASYIVTVTDANGCTSGANYGYLANASTDIYGHVNYYGGSLTTGTNTAVIYKRLPFFTAFDTIQVQPVNASGDFHFTAINHDDYLIKIFADTLLHGDLEPTYYGDKWAWDFATPITHDCSLPDTTDITMIHDIGLVGGPGFASGRITEGMGYGHAPSDPIPGVDVHLGRNPGGASMITTTTNTSGGYSFSNIPYNVAGEHYTVYVDIPGLGRDSSYSFVVDSINSNFTNLDYYVDSTTIYIVNTTGISNPSMASENNFNVYPNPFKDNTTIEYVINSNATVKLNVYNVLGDNINSIASEKQTAGTHKYTLGNLHSGVYFIRLCVDKNVTTKRIIVIE